MIVTNLDITSSLPASLTHSLVNEDIASLLRTLSKFLFHVAKIFYCDTRSSILLIGYAVLFGHTCEKYTIHQTIHNPCKCNSFLIFLCVTEFSVIIEF